MKLSHSFALVPLLALNLACALNHPLPVPDHPDGARLKAIVEREQQLTSAIAQWRYGVVSTYLAKNFRCSVANSRFYTAEGGPPLTLACTGFGHNYSPYPSQAYYSYFFQSPMPRTATIDDMAVQFHEDSAKVVSLQTYTNWLPYSDSRPRRSRVTDIWVEDDGEWRLLQRSSEPLPPNADAKLLPSS